MSSVLSQFRKNQNIFFFEKKRKETKTENYVEFQVWKGQNKEQVAKQEIKNTERLITTVIVLFIFFEIMSVIMLFWWISGIRSVRSEFLSNFNWEFWRKK